VVGTVGKPVPWCWGYDYESVLVLPILVLQLLLPVLFSGYVAVMWLWLSNSLMVVHFPLSSCCWFVLVLDWYRVVIV
jgi:hypothetical protein